MILKVLKAVLEHDAMLFRSCNVSDELAASIFSLKMEAACISAASLFIYTASHPGRQ
jgi:hypothetical protein